MVKKVKRVNVQKEIEIPQGIEVIIEKNKIVCKKDSKELVRIIDPNMKATKNGNKLILVLENARRSEKRLIGTAASHLRNIFEGLLNPWEYELEICNVHFPVTVNFDKVKGDFIVKNLLGERAPRIIKAFSPEKIEVEIKVPRIKIKSYDLEAAGQNAANLEKITKIKSRDRNKFQDGIFITKKPGKSYL
jgi:large subunit ribosomal protein L6